MKTKQTILFSMLAILLLLCASLSYAKDKYTLTDAEQREWAQFTQIDQQLSQRLFATVEQARSLSAANTEQAVRFLAAIKEALSAIEANDLRKQLWLEQLRAAKAIPGGVIEGKELVKPPKAAE
jgi:hypothetical protein